MRPGSHVGPFDPDRAYLDPDLSALYDLLNPWGGSDELFAAAIAERAAVVDIGCGTGRLLRTARARGHSGRLCGVDPAAAMLRTARTRTDVEWVQGHITDLADRRAFDLAVMTGRSFQFIVPEEEVTATLAAIHDVLAPDGRLLIEVSNPLRRPWKAWTPAGATTVVGSTGSPVTVSHDVVPPVAADRETFTVTFTETFTSPMWPAPIVSGSIIRFYTANELRRRVEGAGFRVLALLGDESGRPFHTDSPTIIVDAVA